MPSSKKRWDAENVTKGPCIIHAARVKRIPEHVAELNKPRGHGKRVRVRKAMDLDRSRACIQGLGTTYLYPANIGEVDHGSEV